MHARTHTHTNTHTHTHSHPASPRAHQAVVSQVDPQKGVFRLSTKTLESHPGQMLHDKQGVYANAAALQAARQRGEGKAFLQQLQQRRAKEGRHKLAAAIKESGIKVSQSQPALLYMTHVHVLYV